MTKTIRLILIGDRQGIVEADADLTPEKAKVLREQLEEALAAGRSMVLSDQWEVIDRRPALDVARLFEALGNATGMRWDGEAIAQEYERLRVAAMTPTTVIDNNDG